LDGISSVYPQSVQYIEENGVIIVKKTYEDITTAEVEAVSAEFGLNGQTYRRRDVLQSTIEGETIMITAEKSAQTIVEPGKEKMAASLFPPSLQYEQDGFTGVLTLDTSSVQTSPTDSESYSYQYEKVIPTGQYSRNDPAEISRTYGDMKLTKLSFDGRNSDYGAAAVYTGTAWASRVTQYTATALYRGEATLTQPEKIFYTIVFAPVPTAEEVSDEPKSEIYIETEIAKAEAPTGTTDDEITVLTEKTENSQEETQGFSLTATAALIAFVLIGVLDLSAAILIFALRKRKNKKGDDAV
jgi:hypothetical protein